MGLPLHPWCLEVYIRASFDGRGKVDVDGLGEWWEQADEFGEVDRIPRAMGLEECAGQYWSHVQGKEFVIMDPLQDAKLVGILRDAVELSDSFDPTTSAFATREDSAMDPKNDTSTNDPFLSLPPEILQHLLTYLPASSIGALRQSSRALTHIPISFFYHLLRKDFPWIWEADLETSKALPKYSKWTGVVIKEAAREPEGEIIEPPGEVDSDAGEEDTDAAEDAAAAATATLTDDGVAGSNESSKDDYRQPPVLPRFQTNWFKLYAALKKNGKEIPGLRNRERIWRDCGEIMKKIDEMRVRDKEAEEWA
jgi:hypothetical protein